MIVWSGRDTGSAYLNTGGRYNPTTDAWTPTSAGANVPSVRRNAKAVWSGAEMVVWGGRESGGKLNTGGRYDPATDSWTATSTAANVPVPRSSHTVLWTGLEMIVWGGSDASSNRLNTGGRYNPTTDSWTGTSTGLNVPPAKYQHAFLWTGNEVIVWGGNPRDNNLGLYCSSSSSSSSAGTVSNLTIDKSATDLQLSWNADCGAGDSYAIYRGDLALGYGSIAMDLCGVATNEATIAMGAPDAEFFLVVPVWSVQEGSYGESAAGERAPAPSACHPQGALDVCAFQ
jgi:hypothetical protein